MPLFRPVAGQIFEFGGVIADKNIPYSIADFSGQILTRVNGWSQMGSINKTSQNIDVPLIDQDWDATAKGTRQPFEFTNRFAYQPDDPGQQALIAAEKSREFFAARITGNNQPLGTPKTFTVTAASPGVFTSNAHGYANDTPVKLSTTGALLTGLVAGQTYYVVNTATNTFQLALTPGGAAINTSGTQSGVHSVAQVGTAAGFWIAGLITAVNKPNGEANTAQFLELTMRCRMHEVEFAAVTPA